MIQTDLVKIHADDPVFQITWVVNNICTNHCRYCPSYLHSGKNHHYEWLHAERFARSVIERYPKISLSISGGEPTVSPWLKDLVNLFLDRGHEVGLTSNGVRPGRYWDDCRPDYVCLSYHPAFEDESWLVRAIETGRRIPRTTARIMMDPLHWDRCVKMYHTLLNSQLGVEPVKIVHWPRAQRVSYSQAQLAWLAQEDLYRNPRTEQEIKFPDNRMAYSIHGSQEPATGSWANRLINQNLNYFTGWQCDIGINSLFVQWDGSYRRGNCEQGGFLGWIQDPKINWPTEPVICEYTTCGCTTDIMINKRLIPIQRGGFLSTGGEAAER